MTLVQTTLWVLLASATAFCQAPSLTVEGANGQTITMTAADLAKLPHNTIQATDHGTPVTFEGVLISDVLAAVDMPVGEKLRGKALAQYLLVEAADGYRVVFALAELDPAFSDKRVYLATTHDGKPMSDKEGPFRIVAPDEKRPARWVRQVTALRIKPAQ